jgi:RNA polymerase sigma-70 factor (ECF subfamily)
MQAGTLKELIWERQKQPTKTDRKVIQLKPQIQHIHQDLIEKSKTGDRRAQYSLYELYVDAMFTVAMRMLNNPEDAEDALQESFISAFTKIETFRYESTFGAWLKRIVLNKCFNALEKKRIPIFSLQEEDPAVEFKSETFETPAQEKLKIKKIKAGMHMLPDGYRRILSLYLLEGFDHKEISEISGITESTSKSQYHRAKKKLAQILKDI